MGKSLKREQNRTSKYCREFYIQIVPVDKTNKYEQINKVKMISAHI